MTVTGIELRTVVAEYEQWLRSWASEKTAEARVTLASAFLNDYGLAGVTARNVQEFLARPVKKTGKPKSKWTRATYHNHLTDLCNWLVASGYIDTSPMEDVKATKRPGPAPRPLTQVEAERVLGVVEGEVRDWLLCAMLAGLRVSEIARLRGEDIGVDGVFVRGKGDVSATLPCHPDLWEMAQRYPRHGYLWPGNFDGHINPQQISLTVGRLFRSLGISGSIHRGRHYYATTLLRQGVNIRRVQKLMRHANLETTATYTAVDEDELRDAINLLPSLSIPRLV